MPTRPSVARAVGVPAAIGILIAGPILIGSREEAEAPPPREGELTLRLEGDEGKNAEYVLLEASGKPPATPWLLRDETGLKTGRATSVEEAKCKGERVRSTAAAPATGARRWCIELTSVPLHHEVTGTATGVADPATTPATKLTLTVTRRDSIWSALLMIAVGLLAGLIVGLVPANLTRLAKRVQLGVRQWGNRRARSGNAISGVDAWVEMRLAGGASDADVLAQLAPVLKDGPNRARAARDALKAELEAKPLPPGHPYAAAAEAEAGKQTHAIGDFLQPDGTARDAHPAAEWAAGLTDVTADKQVMDEARTQIADLPAGPERTAAEQALAQAEAEWRALDAPGEVERMDARLTRLHDAIVAARAAAPAPAGARPQAAGAGAAARSHATPSQLTLSGTGLVVGAIVAVVLMLIALALVVAFAAATALHGVYEPDDTFGTCWDYFELFSASLASGAAAAVLGLLAMWKADAPPAE